MWQEMYKMAYHYLLSLGLRREDAEDLAQEALLSTYLHLDGIQEGKLKTYVVVAARSKYFDFLERQRRTRLLLAEESRLAAAGCPSEEDNDDKQMVETAIRQLKPKERALLMMKYRVGLSAREIARMLGTTADSVKTALWRARNKLKSYFNEEGG